MKILLNDYQCNYPGNNWPIVGGTANFARFFYPILTGTGHQLVHVTYRYVDTCRRGKALIRGEFPANNWWEVNLPKGYFTKNFTNYEGANIEHDNWGKDLVSACRQIIRAEKPDIVLLNGSYAFPWAILIASNIENVPVVIHHAGIWSVEVDMYSDRFTTGGLKRLRQMIRDTAILPAGHIFLNQMSADVFKEKSGAKVKGRVGVIRLPSSQLPKLPPQGGAEKGNEKKEHKIGIVARWDRIKNHRAFFEIARLAREKELPWKFYAITIIPPTDFQSEFKKEYRKYVKVLTHRSYARLKKFYQEMDMLILPSHFDVSPGVVIEAAMVGTPTVISKNVGYVDEFVSNGAKRFIVDFSDSGKALKSLMGIVGRTYPKRLLHKLHHDHNPMFVALEYDKFFKSIVK